MKQVSSSSAVLGILATAALALAAGCEATVVMGGSSEETTAALGNGNGPGSGGSGGDHLPSCKGGITKVFAIDKLFLGDIDPDGTNNPVGGWKQYGLDLDGVASTNDSTGLCLPRAGGSKGAVYPDGYDGRDNSFGKNILPIILGLASNYSTLVNQDIQSGKFTYMLAIEGVGAPMPCTAPSRLFRGDNLAPPPQWDGSDAFPLGPDCLSDPSEPYLSAKNVFLDSTIQFGQYRSGPEANFNLVLGDGEDAIFAPIPIHHARFEMKLTPGLDGAVEGQLGGVIDTEDFVAGIAKAAAKFDTVFCDPSSYTLQIILDQIRRASDIMKDGTQDPTHECDGISIGLGFTMKAAQLGPVAPPDPPAIDPCMP